MNAAETGEHDFEQLREFVGPALRDVRADRNKQQVSRFLRLIGGLREGTEDWVSNVEAGRIKLFFREFEIFCQALDVSAKTVLDRAWEMKKQSALKK